MDIAFAVANDLDSNGTETKPAPPDPFMILAVVPDDDEYDQDHQRNYTAVVTLPNMECDHCVIRARYVAHKPGETTFYQCSDVRVRMSSRGQSNVGSGVLQLLENPMEKEHADTAVLEPEGQETLTTILSSKQRIKAKPTAESLDALSIALPQRDSIPKYEVVDGENLVQDHAKSLTEVLGLENAKELKNPKYIRPALRKQDHGKDGEKRVRRALRLIRSSISPMPRSSSRGPWVTSQPRNNRATPEISTRTELPAYYGSYSNQRTRKFQTPSLPSQSSSPKLLGMSNQADSPQGAVYYSIDVVTGERREIGVLDFHVDSPFDPHQIKSLAALNGSISFVTDGVLTVDGARQLSLMPLNVYKDMDRVADKVVAINTYTGRTEKILNVTALNMTKLMSAFSAVVVEIEDTYCTFNIEPSGQAGKYNFIIGRLYSTGTWEELSRYEENEDTFINYMWAEYDIAVKTLYVLLGNENDPYKLTARLYKFFVPPWSPVKPAPEPSAPYVNLDVSKFTFMSFHLNSLDTSKLFAISPGRHDASYPAYHLVSIDVDTGHVTDLAQITPPGIFERYYGGTIFNGADDINHSIMHVLRVGDSQADVIVTVDVWRFNVTFSQLTNLRHMHNLVYAGPS